MPENTASQLLLERILREMEGINTKLDVVSAKTSKIESCYNVMSEKLITINRDVTGHHEFINGNGKTGVKTRVDRLEQTSDFQKKGFWITVSGLIALILKAVYEFIAGLPTGGTP